MLCIKKRSIFVKQQNSTNLPAAGRNERTLMNLHKTATKLREKISKFSGYVSSQMDKTLQRFLAETVHGRITSQSVMLTKINRLIESKVSLKK